MSAKFIRVMRNIVLFPRLSTELLSALIIGVSFIHVRKMAALHWLYNAHTVRIGRTVKLEVRSLCCVNRREVNMN